MFSWVFSKLENGVLEMFSCVLVCAVCAATCSVALVARIELYRAATHAMCNTRLLCDGTGRGGDSGTDREINVYHTLPLTDNSMNKKLPT